MKLTNVDNQLLFPTPIWTIEYAEYEPVNDGILAEMDTVDWPAEHARAGLDQVVEDRYREDIFITPALVPSVKRVIQAFSATRGSSLARRANAGRCE